MIEENYSGLACPEPVIKCKQFLEKNRPEHFQVIVDNEAASENIKRFVKTNGYFAEIIEKNPSYFIVKAVIDQNYSAKESNDACEIITDFPSLSSSSMTHKTMFIIPSERIGTGDDVLGEKLMENFLSTLPEMADNILKIVLLNGGVKLSTKAGKSLKALQALEESNIEILVCGSCLEFYGLTKSKQVGVSTNMLDIITSIDIADKVVRI